MINIIIYYHKASHSEVPYVRANACCDGSEFYHAASMARCGIGQCRFRQTDKQIFEIIQAFIIVLVAFFFLWLLLRVLHDHL